MPGEAGVDCAPRDDLGTCSRPIIPKPDALALQAPPAVEALLILAKGERSDRARADPRVAQARRRRTMRRAGPPHQRGPPVEAMLE